MKANELLSNSFSDENNIHPNPIDKRVGSRIRLRRKLLGYSQEKLALALGLSFQQIQKYEKGLNRVGASRLYYIAQVLQVPINFFFDEILNEAINNKKLVSSSLSDPISIQDISVDEAGKTHTNEELEVLNSNIVNNKETIALLKAYYKIKDKEIRQKLLHLIKVMAV